MLGLLASVKATFIAAGVAFALGFAGGWQVQGWRWDAAIKQAQDEAIERFREQQQEDQQLAVEAARREARREARQRQVQREVPDAVASVRDADECAADEHIVRLWNEAASAAASATTAGGGDAAVPDAGGDQPPDS